MKNTDIGGLANRIKINSVIIFFVCTLNTLSAQIAHHQATPSVIFNKDKYANILPGNLRTINVDTSNGIIWYPPIQLSDDTISSGVPHIAASGDDTVHVTWKTDSPDYTLMKLPYVKIVTGAVVTKRDLLQDYPQFPYYVAYPVIIARDDHVWIFFTQPTGDYDPLYMIASSDGGTSWNLPTAITSEVADRVYSPTVAVPTLAVLYPSHSPSKILRSTNNGMSWSRTNEYLDNYAKIALTEGYLHLVQHTWQSPAVEIEYRRSSNFGDTWEIDTVISDVDGYYSDLPAISGYTSKCGSELLTAWRDVKYGILPGLDLGASIISRSSLDQGTHWYPENLLTNEPRGFDPTTAINGKARAVGADYQIDYWTFHVSALATNSSFFFQDTLKDLSPGAVIAGGQSIAVTSSAVHLVWEQKVGSTFRIFYRRGEFIQSNAQFSVSTGSLEMDTTTLHHTIIDSITITNPGSDRLIINNAISVDNNFSITPDRDTIESGTEKTFYINFTPKDYGFSSGKIIFYHNGQSIAGESSDCITVTGVCRWNIDTIQYRANNWNMVSIPVNTSQYYNLPSMFTYEGSYVPKDTMVLGVGYWAKPEATIHYAGEMLWEDTLNVKKGWNMVGTLSAPVAVKNITTIPESNIQSVFFGYDGINYVQADSLYPGQAYWVKLKQGGKLILKMK